MELFEILGFSGPRLRVPLATSWAWNGSRDKIAWIFEIWKVELESNQRYEQNPEIISKMEKIDFSSKFAWKLKFHENQGKFELKLFLWDAINYIRGIKNCILYLEFLFSPSPTNLQPSQTDGTENGRKLFLESTSYENQWYQVILAHFLLTIFQMWRWNVLDLWNFGSLIPLLIASHGQTVKLTRGFPRLVNQLPCETNCTSFKKNLIDWLLS